MAVFSVDSDAVLATTAAVRGTIDRLQAETQAMLVQLTQLQSQLDGQRIGRVLDCRRSVARHAAQRRRQSGGHQRRPRDRRPPVRRRRAGDDEPVPLTAVPTQKSPGRSRGSSVYSVGLEVHATGRVAGRSRRLLRLVGDDGLGREEQRGDRCGVLQRRARDLGRVDDALSEEVAVLAGRGVEAVTRGQAPRPCSRRRRARDRR